VAQAAGKQAVVQAVAQAASEQVVV